MKRVLSLAGLAAAALVLVGCGGAQVAGAEPQRIDPNQPAYLSMGSGDTLGRVFIKDRIYFARKNQDSDKAFAVAGEETPSGE